MLPRRLVSSLGQFQVLLVVILRRLEKTLRKFGKFSFSKLIKKTKRFSKFVRSLEKKFNCRKLSSNIDGLG